MFFKSLAPVVKSVAKGAVSGAKVGTAFSLPPLFFAAGMFKNPNRFNKDGAVELSRGIAYGGMMAIPGGAVIGGAARLYNALPLTDYRTSFLNRILQNQKGPSPLTIAIAAAGVVAYQIGKKI